MISIWIFLLLGLVATGIIDASAQVYDPLQRKSQLVWSLGEGLQPGDVFVYRICDAYLRIPESPDPCYVVQMHFLNLLDGIEGKTWIVSAHVDHKIRQLDMIFHIVADSFSIRTDRQSIQYAQSIERTLQWIGKYASKHEPQSLRIGSIWGIVPSDSPTSNDLIVSQIDSIKIQNTRYDTYKVTYLLIKESFLQIKDEFPFPITAHAYKPVSTHQNVPLAFSFELVSYENYTMCSYNK
ncbi:MAG: hypothetical protein QXW91_01120 [Candidatus Nitrosotenuis sp.]